MSIGPMNGWRALDLTDEKGFLCGKLLADLGVDVIKVEKPGGDPSRNSPPYYHDIEDPEKSLYWFSYNCNKRSITLNFETDEGQDLFKRLVKNTDFLIESYPPGYMSDYKLNYEELEKLNPSLVMTSITPFGQDGPYAKFKGSDIVVQAMGTVLSLFGDTDRAPVRMSIPQAYMHAGADAAEGTMIAHYYRKLTGIGQHVDVSAMESAIRSIHYFLALWDGWKVDQPRVGSLSVNSGLKCPVIWECQDGFIVYGLNAGLMGARSNRALTEWMRSENKAPDSMLNKDWENWDWLQTTQSELDSYIKPISKFFGAHTKKYLEEEAQQRGLMLAIVADSSEVVNSSQLRSRDFWKEVEHPELKDKIIYPGAFAKFIPEPIDQNWVHAPVIGENNREIYVKELGLSEEEINVLKSGRTI